VQYASVPADAGGRRGSALTNHRKPLFYGWWITGAAAVGMALGAPSILVFAFPVFLKAFAKDFHASRSAIAFAFSLHNIVSALASPVAGRVIDRIGVRKVALGSTLLFAALMLGNRFITVSVAGIYVFNILGALIGIGCGPIPYSAVVSKWFDRRRGSALAIGMAGLGVAALVLPSVVQRVIIVSGWRTAYALYGAAMLLISFPVLWSLLKNAPAEMGLFPDGASSASLARIDAEGRTGMKWREVRGTSTFWILVSAVVLVAASVHACVIHLAAMLTDHGVSPQMAALASSAAGAGLLAGRVSTGFLLDRYFGPQVVMGSSAGAGLGIILLLFTHGTVLTFVGAFLAGLGMGAEGDTIAYLTSRYFGLKSFAEIYGYVFGAFVLAGATGAFLMGVGFDRTGSYTVPLLGFLVATVIAILLFGQLGPYRYVHIETVAPAIEHQMSAAAQ
jgi:MFS family permease